MTFQHEQKHINQERQRRLNESIYLPLQAHTTSKLRIRSARREKRNKVKQTHRHTHKTVNKYGLSFPPMDIISFSQTPFSIIRFYAFCFCHSSVLHFFSFLHWMEWLNFVWICFCFSSSVLIWTDRETAKNEHGNDKTKAFSADAQVVVCFLISKLGGSLLQSVAHLRSFPCVSLFFVCHSWERERAAAAQESFI